MSGLVSAGDCLAYLDAGEETIPVSGPYSWDRTHKSDLYSGVVSLDTARHLLTYYSGLLGSACK